MAQTNSPRPVALGKLRDPDYFGVNIIRHLLAIVFVLFAVLGMGMYLLLDTWSLEVNVSGTTTRVFPCAEQPGTCLVLNVTSEDFAKVAPGDLARVKLAEDRDFRFSMREGVVIQVNTPLVLVQAEHTSEVIVALPLTKRSVELSEVDAVFIAVERSSALNTVKSRWRELF